MRRRDFIIGIGGAAAWPVVALAQNTPRLVAIQLGTSSQDVEQTKLVGTFVKELSRLGWSDGRNIQIIYRWGDGDPERVKQQATEIAKLAPDVIFGQGTPVTLALNNVTSSIPVVFVNVSDPVGSRIVDSLARPGGNLTGFTNYEPSMGGKWLEVLREIAPRLNSVLIIFNPDNPAGAQHAQSIEALAHNVGIRAIQAPARTGAEIERQIDVFRPGHVT